MGTLKLGHIKTRPHLKTSIAYVMKESKTENGKHVFGNSGHRPDWALATFRETKKIWDKDWGRQAYHYILTFAEEDGICADLAQSITEEFMRLLFPSSDYDWVGCVHTDTEHIHSHVIFNSVNGKTGYKYRYEKGDWEKTIQKIADGICQKHGLRTIAYDYDQEGKAVRKEAGEKQATNHEKHNQELQRTADFVRQDLDRCVPRADDFGELLELMKRDGYKVRKGVSKKYGEYVTFTPYGMDRGVRTYRLGKEYGVEALKLRVQDPEKERVEEPEMGRQERMKRIAKLPALTYRRWYVKRIYIARRWKNGAPFPNSCQYKRAVIEAAKTLEEYNLLKKMGFKTQQEIKAFLEAGDAELKERCRARKACRDLGERALMEQGIGEKRKEQKIAKRILRQVEFFELEESQMERGAKEHGKSK